jgi:lysine-specific permease
MHTESLEKSLKTRHITMIAIGGSLGTGVFLTLGSSLSVGSIGGALSAYIIMAVVVYFLMTSLGEMSVFAPSSGSLCEYSRLYVSESFGFAMNINYWFNWVSCLALEISAAALIMSYWFPHISSNVFAIFFFILLLILNLFSVKLYGELEYWLSFIKIGVVVTFLVLGFFVIIRQPHLGTEKWFLEDSPFHQSWFGFLSVFALAGFSFQGTELVGVAVGETKNPENTIPTSIKLIFWRLTVCYLLSLIVISLLIPFNSSLLLSGDSVKTSPFTIVFRQFAGSYAADAVNFTVLIALLSAANASLYSASRVLWNFASQQKAILKFAKIHKSGVPVMAVGTTWILALLIFIFAVMFGDNVVGFLTQITAIAGFIAWFGVSLSHYRFRTKYLPQLGGLDILKYKAKFFPYAQIFSMVMVVVIVILQGILYPINSIFSYLCVYSSIILFILCFLGFKMLLLRKG